jgi:hypothetical protein
LKTTPALTVYRRLAALLFEEAVGATGLSPGQLGLRLREELSRPTLTAPTLRAWRRGNKAVPFAAFLATCKIANVRPGSVVARLTDLAEVGIDDSELVELLLELRRLPPVARLSRLSE